MLDREPYHSNWASFGGGGALAYVFVYLLPSLASKQMVLQESTDGGLLGFLEHHVYLVSLVGLTIFFGFARAGELLEASAESGRRLPKRLRSFLVMGDVAGAMGYYVLTAYLVSEWTRLSSVVLMATAMALHFAAMNQRVRAPPQGRL